jgi:hypothetical protein
MRKLALFLQAFESVSTRRLSSGRRLSNVELVVQYAVDAPEDGSEVDITAIQEKLVAAQDADTGAALMEELITEIETSIEEEAGITVEVVGVSVETVAIATAAPTPKPTPVAVSWARGFCDRFIPLRHHRGRDLPELEERLHGRAEDGVGTRR